MRKLSSIQLHEDTKEILGQLIAHKGESYESIILRLVEVYKSNKITRDKVSIEKDVESTIKGRGKKTLPHH